MKPNPNPNPYPHPHPDQAAEERRVEEARRNDLIKQEREEQP